MLTSDSLFVMNKSLYGSLGSIVECSCVSQLVSVCESGVGTGEFTAEVREIPEQSSRPQIIGEKVDGIFQSCKDAYASVDDCKIKGGWVGNVKSEEQCYE